MAPKSFIQKSKRGRPSKTDLIARANAESLLHPRQHRDPFSDVSQGPSESSRKNEVSRPLKRKAAAVQPLTVEQQGPSRKRGRHSNTDGQTEISTTHHRRKLQHPKVDVPGDIDATTIEEERRRKPGRPSLKGVQNTPRQSSQKKAPEVEAVIRHPRPHPEYQHLAALDRQVPRQTIDGKWAPLPPNAIDRVYQILENVERSVVMRLQEDRKRTQASTAVQMVIRKLQRKLSRGLPFPPGSQSQRDDDFDFEKLIDTSRLLESQLTPALHSVELLKAEIKKEDAQLEIDKAMLEELKQNAQAESSRRKNNMRKLHPVLYSDDLLVKKEDNQLHLLSQKSHYLLTTISNDEKLEILSDELHSHLESIDGNVGQVRGLIQAVDKSRAAVRDILFRNVDSQHYERVIIG